MNSRTVSRLVGCSLRQLQWWDERGLISPRIIAGNRDYSSWDFWRCALLKELSGTGSDLSRPILKPGRRLMQKRLLLFGFNRGEIADRLRRFRPRMLMAASNDATQILAIASRAKTDVRLIDMGRWRDYIETHLEDFYDTRTNGAVPSAALTEAHRTALERSKRILSAGSGGADCGNVGLLAGATNQRKVPAPSDGCA